MENVLSNKELSLDFHLVAHVSPHWSIVLGNHEVLNGIATGSQFCSTTDKNESKPEDEDEEALVSFKKKLSQAPT